MHDIEARLLFLENKVKEQDEAIASFDRMFLLTLERFLKIQQDINHLEQAIDIVLDITEKRADTIDKILTFLERVKPQVDELWQDFQVRKVYKSIEHLN
jgi:predicted hydrocarbon binding protein